jgi:hypothetical protein
MPERLRLLLLFGPPVLVGAVNLAHPLIPSPVYAGVHHHLQWWIILHVINLALFPLLGLSAYVLLQDVHNLAATLSRIAIAVFVPVYAAFDALMGIGTGVLVELSLKQPPDRMPSMEPLINAFYDSAVLYALATIGSIAWIVAMLAAAIAFIMPDRRRLVAIVAVISFPIGGWARTNLFLAPDGVTITTAWWLVTIAVGVVMSLIGKPRVTSALLALSGALFGAQHVTPTGPLGAACFLGAAAYVKFVMAREHGVTGLAEAAGT